MSRPPRRRRGPAKATPPPQEFVLTIDHVGHRGDGLARTEHGQVFVPKVLAGETVRVSVTGDRGRVIEMMEPSAERVAPFCPHFDRCGGCTSQHMATAPYHAWKLGIVRTALRNRGIEAEIDPIVDAHGVGRRRATFHAQADGRWIVGYREARSHRIVDLDQCPILSSDLSRAPALVRTLGEAVKQLNAFDAHLTHTAGGIDIQIRSSGLRADRLDLHSRTALAEIAHRMALARITIGDDIIVERTPPAIHMGPATVILPPGSFLQATEAAERTLAELVCAHLEPAARTADLFSGLGPFALRLMVKAAIDAFDSDRAAIQALNKAAGMLKASRPVTATERDLFVRPLIAEELNRFDGIVFDPPRAGSESQARQIATSRVPLVAAVSCDAATFARDAAILIGGGYKLTRIVPVDQFKWSPHIEIVGLFRR